MSSLEGVEVGVLRDRFKYKAYLKECHEGKKE
jgi:hypothetical protein